MSNDINSNYREIFSKLNINDINGQSDSVHEYKAFQDTLKNADKPIPMYEWILLSCHASYNLKSAIIAVNDAYKLGFMAGKESRGI